MTSFHDSAVFSETVYIQYRIHKDEIFKNLANYANKSWFTTPLILENFSMYKHACIYRCDQK